MPIGILYRQELKEYHFGSGHSFRGDRYERFIRHLSESIPEDDNYRILDAQPATDADLLSICDREYVDFTREYYKAASLGLPRPDGFARFHSDDNYPSGRPGRLEEAARLVVGQAKAASDLIQAGRFKKVVSLGGGLHHAKRSYGEGFCLYNDVAFCATYLIRQYGLKKVLVLDTDAHAGNGTSEYFYDDPRVLFMDLHQDPWTLYPGVGFAHEMGRGEATGFTINIPLPPGAGYDSYKLAFETIVQPVAREFGPEIIIRNGGSDPHFNDKLANLGLTLAGFKMIGEKVEEMAGVCGGRVIDMIASGYNEDVLPGAWLALIAGLAGFDLKEAMEDVPHRFRTDAALSETHHVLREVKTQLKDYWKCLR
jgi:acetoin utilization protein AcuC